MQKVQYPNLLQNNIQSETNSYSSPQTVMIENNYMPTYNQNQQQQQQNQVQIVYYAVQVAPQEVLQPNYSPYVKDLPFQQQKNYLMEILGLFLMWTFIHIFFLFILQETFRHLSDATVYFTLLFIGFIFMILFSLLGLKIKNRKNSVLYFIATVLSYILTFFACYQLMNNSGGFDFGYIVSLIIILTQISNLVVTIIMILCISCLNKEFNTLNIIGIVFIILIPISFLTLGFLFIFNFGFLYTILLSNSLKQILNGRYKLKRDEVMVGAIAANYGIYICCENDDF